MENEQQWVKMRFAERYNEVIYLLYVVHLTLFISWMRVNNELEEMWKEAVMT
jgi:hypothetical protein